MDKVYIITGANKGLGDAFVDYVLKETNTFAVSISRTINSKQIDYLKRGRFIFIEQDLSRNIDYTAFNKLSEVVGSKSKITFINNAGTISPLDEVSKLSDSEITYAINVNVMAPVFITKYLLQHFKENEICFVNISSGAADKSISNWSIYSSSKAFVNRFFEIVKKENKNNNNFSFRSIDPGLIDTEMQREIRSSQFPRRDVFDEAKQKGLLATPAEAAKRVLDQL